jgi:hypothetical protein
MSIPIKVCAGFLGAAMAEFVLFGCGASDADNAIPMLPTAGGSMSVVTSSAAAAGNPAMGAAVSGSGGATATTAKSAAAAGKKATPAGAAGTKATTATTGSGGTVGNATTPNTGPEDGDPSKPMVSIDGVKCGVPNIMSLQTVKITNRDVVVGYPCAHEGAPVTFFLFLHGTVPGDAAQKRMFTMNAWPVHNLVDSHNIIVVVPTAASADTNQWGNGDNGQDLPHLYDVVDWVYNTFGTKFDIRSMWAQGGSWGAFYLATVFACDAKFQDRLKGIQLVVGGGCPTCSNRLSCVVAQQELEKGGGNPVSDEEKEKLSSGAAIDSYATAHGCDAKGPMTSLGDSKAWDWANCDPGWEHAYYLGPKNHADAWDPVVVKKATDDIKATEK